VKARILKSRWLSPTLTSPVDTCILQPRTSEPPSFGTKTMKIIRAISSEHIAEARRLFREYANFLNVDLCFQDFESELAHLPGAYSPPTGVLLLAVDKSTTLGCVALREAGDGTCEMKRLYVRPQARGHGIGRALAIEVINEAVGLGYITMRLDTFDWLVEAIHLYESLGFSRIPAYYSNPLSGVVYWELDLKEWSRSNILLKRTH
jgi:putative acetyltransferase